MTIFVTRHGESLTNADVHHTSAFAINNDSNVLTRHGIKQALDYGHYIDGQDLQHIVASDHSRTKQTAMLIASTLHCGVPMSFTPALREISWEDPTTAKWSKLSDYAPGGNTDIFYDDIDARPHPAAETQRDVYNRAIPALISLVEQHGDSPILLVTHYFVVRAFQAFMSGQGVEAMPQYDPDNLCRLRFDAATVRAAAFITKAQRAADGQL